MLNYTLHIEMKVLEVQLHPFILAYGTRRLGPTAVVCMWWRRKNPRLWRKL